MGIMHESMLDLQAMPINLKTFEPPWPICASFLMMWILCYSMPGERFVDSSLNIILIIFEWLRPLWLCYNSIWELQPFIFISWDPLSHSDVKLFTKKVKLLLLDKMFYDACIKYISSKLEENWSMTYFKSVKIYIYSTLNKIKYFWIWIQNFSGDGDSTFVLTLMREFAFIWGHDIFLSKYILLSHDRRLRYFITIIFSVGYIF